MALLWYMKESRVHLGEPVKDEYSAFLKRSDQDGEATTTKKDFTCRNNCKPVLGRMCTPVFHEIMFPSVFNSYAFHKRKVCCTFNSLWFKTKQQKNKRGLVYKTAV